MFNPAQEIWSNYGGGGGGGGELCKSRVLWKSKTDSIYLEILSGETSDLPSSAVLSQQSVVRDHISHFLLYKNQRNTRVAWSMYKTTLVAVLQKMT